jgi:hypothetical protein
MILQGLGTGVGQTWLVMGMDTFKKVEGFNVMNVAE